jgi:hypothetical protein
MLRTSSRGHRLCHWAGRRRGRAQIHFEALSGDLLGMNNEVTTQSRVRFQRSQLRHLLAEDARPHARFDISQCARVSGRVFAHCVSSLAIRKQDGEECVGSFFALQVNLLVLPIRSEHASHAWKASRLLTTAFGDGADRRELHHGGSEDKASTVSDMTG